MTILYEGRHPGEAIMTEAKGQISREAITVAESQTIEANSLVSVVGDNYVAFTPGAATGAETPVGMAIYAVTTGAGETAKVTAIVRHAELNEHCIAWPDGATPENKADAKAALEARDILLRS